MSNRIACCLCAETQSETLYEGIIRSGESNDYTSETHQVVKCKGCNLVRLAHDPNQENFYQSESYRNNYNESAQVDDYFIAHDNEQPPRLEYLGLNRFRNKITLDMGCGGGSFLDMVQGVSIETVAIEPFQGYHASLKERGHTPFNSAESALHIYRGKIQNLISFGVIEHVSNPFDYLKQAHELLEDGGEMHLETDNLNDVLMLLDAKNFNQFFYRTAHLWYFDGDTLERLARKVGFSQLKLFYRHNYDLSNTLMWLKAGKPTGIGHLTMLDDQINQAWQSFLNTNGMGDLLCMTLTK